MKYLLIVVGLVLIVLGCYFAFVTVHLVLQIAWGVMEFIYTRIRDYLHGIK